MEQKPETTSPEQVDGYWNKMAAFIVWKLLPPGGTVTITLDDIKACQEHFAPDFPVILSRGSAYTLEFSLVSVAEAERAAAEHAEKFAQTIEVTVPTN